MTVSGGNGVTTHRGAGEPLSKETYSFTVRSADAAGNGSTSLTYSFRPRWSGAEWALTKRCGAPPRRQ